MYVYVYSRNFGSEVLATAQVVLPDTVTPEPLLACLCALARIAHARHLATPSTSTSRSRASRGLFAPELSVASPPAAASRHCPCVGSRTSCSLEAIALLLHPCPLNPRPNPNLNLNILERPDER